MNQEFMLISEILFSFCQFSDFEDLIIPSLNMDSPNGIVVKKKLKRRSSSMFNLIEHKNLIEKDMQNSKLSVMRKNDQARRNHRHDLTIKNRNIDFMSIYEESPVVQRIQEPISRDFKIEAMDLGETKKNVNNFYMTC